MPTIPKGATYKYHSGSSPTAEQITQEGLEDEQEADFKQKETSSRRYHRKTTSKANTPTWKMTSTVGSRRRQSCFNQKRGVSESEIMEEAEGKILEA